MVTSTLAINTRVDLPFIISKKLLMKEGVHNGVYYPKEQLQLQACMDSAEEQDLILDHKDTDGEGVANWAGRIQNHYWDDHGEQGPGLYGDIVVLDETIASKLSFKPKWGISPTIDYQKEVAEMENNFGIEEGTPIAMDPMYRSFSLVLEPAVRETMLNALDVKSGRCISTLEINKMTGHEGIKKKKKEDDYPLPQDSLDKSVLKKLDLKLPLGSLAKGTELEVSADAYAVLEDAQTQIIELSKFKDSIQATELAQTVIEVVGTQHLIGQLSEEEIDARHEALMGKSLEVLSELKDVLGVHAELSAFTDFVKAERKKNPKASLKEISVAFKARGQGRNEVDQPIEDPSLTAPQNLNAVPAPTQATLAQLGEPTPADRAVAQMIFGGRRR